MLNRYEFVDGEGVTRVVRADSEGQARRAAARFVRKQTGSVAAGEVAAGTVRKVVK